MTAATQLLIQTITSDLALIKLFTTKTAFWLLLVTIKQGEYSKKMSQTEQKPE